MYNQNWKHIAGSGCFAKGLKCQGEHTKTKIGATERRHFRKAHGPRDEIKLQEFGQVVTGQDRSWWTSKNAISE